MLNPVENSMGSLADTIAQRVDESAKRTENTLRSIISALVLILGVVFVMLYFSRRQLMRQQQRNDLANEDLRSVDAALQILDDATRAEVREKMQEYLDVRGSRQRTCSKRIYSTATATFSVAP